MISWECFETAAPKTLENCQKWCSILIEMHEYSLNCTALKVHPGSAQKRKDVLKSHKNLCETVALSRMLQPCNPEFLTSANTDSKESVSFFFEYSEIVGSLPEKVSVIKWFDWLNASKKYHYTFLRGWWKNCCHKIFGKLSRNVFSSVPCRKFELPNPSTTTTSKTDSTECVSFVCSANFRNCWESIVESSFRKEKKLLRFATLPRNTCMVCSEK